MIHTKLYLDYAEMSQQEINNAFICACGASNMKSLKYLLNSHEAPVNVNWEEVKFRAFKSACFNSRKEVVKFLIVDMKLEKNKEIEEFLESNKNPYAESLFLEQSLIQNNIKKNIFLKI